MFRILQEIRAIININNCVTKPSQSQHLIMYFTHFTLSVNKHTVLCTEQVSQKGKMHRVFAVVLFGSSPYSHLRGLIFGRAKGENQFLEMNRNQVWNLNKYLPAPML
jgi:hypothetical protein